MIRRLIIISVFVMGVGCTHQPKNQSLLELPSVLNADAKGSLSNKITELNKTELIEQIMMKSGMTEMIEELPGVAAMGFDQQSPPPMDRREYEQFRGIYLQAFNASLIRETITRYLNNHYDAKRFTELLTMLRTPLAEKMTELEVQASSVESQQQMMQSANTIMGQVSPERLALIRRLDKAQKATQSMLAMQMTMTRAMMVNTNKLIPKKQQLSERHMADSLEDIRKQSLFPTQQYIQLNMVYAYGAATDAELGNYIALYESKVGRWSIERLNRAWVNVSEAISNKLATLMTQNFVRKNAL